MSTKSQDIRPDFLNIARRLQSIARQNSGVAIVSFRFIVGPGGDIKGWTSPDITLLEPKSQAEELLKLLSP